MRAEGTAIYSLSRNIGSSIGISIVQTILTQHTQIVHSSLVEHITRFNPLLQSPSGAGPSASMLALYDQQINAQAAMIGYIDDFKFLMWMTLLVTPLLLLIRTPKQTVASEASHAVMD
jgi:DHA2 family multidrug resistance protein